MGPLTSSEMRNWQSCQRGWWLTYYRCVRPVGGFSLAMSVGNLVHDGLQRYYEGTLDQTGTIEFAATKASELLDTTEDPDTFEKIMESARLAGIMLEGYFPWAEETGADVGLEFVGAEEMVESQVGPYTLRGKIDARFRREVDGALLQMEHKTVGDFRRIEYAQSDPQFLTYDLLAYLTRGESERTDGILLNMLRRVKRTARAKPPFYDRHEVRHNVEELRSHYKHVMAIGWQIETAREKLDDGAEHHEVCPPSVNSSHGWSCPCSRLGALPDDGSDLEYMIESGFEPYDPYERYNAKEENG